MFKPPSPASLNKEGVGTTESLITKNVVNLSRNFHLSQPQKTLLEKGLTFVPTLDITKGQKEQFKADMIQYHRKIKLAVFFKDSDRQEIPPFTGPSTWSPSMAELPSEIGVLIEKDHKIFHKHYKSLREKHNLTGEEVKALWELRRNNQIVIKPADKGSAVVILDREQYIFEVERQLNDTVYYKALKEPIFKETIPMVKNVLARLRTKKFITEKQERYLKGKPNPRERRFYILPKIHKDPKKWTVPFQIPPGRPIVSDCHSETYFTAEFIDHYLNPLSIRHPSYVRDTYHFISIVKNLEIPTNSFFFSMDVDSLYTNIDIPAGLNSVKKIFQKYPDDARPDNELLDLLNINLTRNDFVFNNKFYLQVKGTAMGKKFAPAYANIFMANWEEQVFAKCPQRPLHYWRYLDDIWGIWTGTKEEFEIFVNILNSHDPSIQLKYELDEKTIDFLDTTTFKGPTFHLSHKLDVKVHFKITDTHALLFKTSLHPKHTFAGIVKSQLLRFKRICTRETDFHEAKRILFTELKKRGYSKPMLRHCLQTFQIVREKQTKKLLPLISPFSRTCRILNNKLRNNFQDVISRSNVLPGVRVISAYRKHKNLKDLLVRARLPALA